MARYIDEDKLINEIDKWLDSVGTAYVGKGLSYYGELLGCIEDTPTADVQEVKHGHWKVTTSYHNPNDLVFRCSVCDDLNLWLPHYKYCPNCGAKMDKVVE